MEILSILFLCIRVRIFIGVLPPSSVGIIPVRNSHLSCNGYICLWLLFISFLGGWGRGHSLTKSSKHSSADHAIYTQLSALAVTNKICHFTKTFMTRKAMELSSSFFFFHSLRETQTGYIQPRLLGPIYPTELIQFWPSPPVGVEICEVQLRVQVCVCGGLQEHVVKLLQRLLKFKAGLNDCSLMLLVLSLALDSGLCTRPVQTMGLLSFLRMQSHMENFSMRKIPKFAPALQRLGLMSVWEIYCVVWTAAERMCSSPCRFPI